MLRKGRLSVELCLSQMQRAPLSQWQVASQHQVLAQEAAWLIQSRPWQRRSAASDERLRCIFTDLMVLQH